MNKGVEYTQWFEDLIVEDKIFQSSVPKKCNHEIFAGEKNPYFHPHEEMIKEWFEGQQEYTFDIDYVNRALKYNW